MGNSSSNTNNKNDNDNENQQYKKTGQLIDYIATHYILTMDFQSLTKLYDKNYCDNLVVITSKIIDKYFSPLEISYLAQRIKNGVEVNETVKENILFFNKEEVNQLNLQNPLRKKRICIGISKFYIKIAHIFAAIITTINPIYIYKDSNGNLVKVPFNKRDEIPSNIPRKLYKLNICQDRIKSLNRGKEEIDIAIKLQEKQGQGQGQGLNNEINVHPNICSFNLDKETLMDEPGIPELMELYYDDNFNYETGKFLKMSDSSRKEYENDLLIFYNVFTGNNVKVLPPNIKSFSDVKLKTYHNTADCQGNNPLFDQAFKGPTNKKLFIQYANNVKNMVKNANDNQESLLKIINELFIYDKNKDKDNNDKENSDKNKENDKLIRVNPKLTEEGLQKIVVETRNLIMKLYLTCELDYTNGIKIYEAIIEKKILDTSNNQINYLSKLSDMLFSKNNDNK